MGGPGRLARAVAILVWALAAIPVLALVPMSVLDVGSRGSIRVTAFPVALTLLDPYVWDCLANSLLMATGVTLASALVGTNLSRWLSFRRFWGHGLARFWLFGTLAIPPAFGAIGLCWALRAIGGWVPGLVTAGGSRGFEAGSWVWLGWFWVALSAGVPVVGLAMDSALRKVDPSWEEAAIWAGASRRAAWRQVAWPVVRPEVARALALVFTLTLLEPGAPIVLGLRRTVGFQIVESSQSLSRPGEPTRAVVLALVGTLLAMAGRIVVGWWGGKALEPPVWRPSGHRLRPAARWPLAAAITSALALLGLSAWLPALALVGASISEREAGADGSITQDPLVIGCVTSSILLGIMVVCFNLCLARLALGLPGRFRGLIRWLEAIPPLAIGVGVVALSGFLAMLAGSGEPSARGPFSWLLATLSGWFDPDLSPWVALTLGAGLVTLPWISQSLVASRDAVEPARMEAALTLGATPRAARRRFGGSGPGATSALLALTFAFAATGVTPALVLAPTAESRPLGPAVLRLAEAPGQGLSRAATLGCLAIALNLAALGASGLGEAVNGVDRRGQPTIPRGHR